MPLQLDALRRAAACCLTFGVLVLGCTDSQPGAPNGQTHWLRECTGSAECGNLLCICGVCSAECDNGESCKAAVGEAAACKAAATASKKGQCPTAPAEKKICVAECSEDAECTDRGANLRCASGVCSLARVAEGNADSGVAGLGDAGLPAADELTCDADGFPAHLPIGVEVVAPDVLASAWTVSKSVLTWGAGKAQDGAGSMLWRQSLPSGSPARVPFLADNAYAQINALGADGADAVLVLRDFSSEATSLRLVPNAGAAVNLALRLSERNSNLLLDADRAYWVEPTDDIMLTLWRAPRTPGFRESLGNATLDGSPNPMRDPLVQGPVALGGWLYLAFSAAGKGQIYRAPIDGSSQLVTFGLRLGSMNGLATDGTDLLLLLDSDTDQLENPISSPRVARMTPEGMISDIALTQAPGVALASAGDTVYWLENAASSTGHGTLWSVLADGSGEPVQVLTSPGIAFPRGPLVYDAGAVYFAIDCSKETADGGMSSVTHIMRYSP